MYNYCRKRRSKDRRRPGTHRYIAPARAERAILVGTELAGRRSSDGDLWTLEDSLQELEQLAHTAGVEVVDKVHQRLIHPDPGTYIGKGKIQELKGRVAETTAGMVIFDEELAPGQQRSLEEALGEQVKLIDRTALILDIFAQHAHTREGQIQVELAQLEYRLPRLTRMWTHLARQAGGRAAGGVGAGGAGGVGLRGPGETQLESDRRRLRKRISTLKDELEEVRRHRQGHRRRRERQGMRVVALVGYTNAGKSSLLNALSRSAVLAEDKLFATLDPTTRRVFLPGGRQALFTDTVGFIQKLPHHLVAAFRATLEEIEEADLLLHVADLSHPKAEAQVRTVDRVLAELGAADRPMLLVWNKLDCLPPEVRAEWPARPHGPEEGAAMAVSARTGEGLPELLAVIERRLEASPPVPPVPPDLLDPSDPPDPSAPPDPGGTPGAG